MSRCKEKSENKLTEHVCICNVELNVCVYVAREVKLKDEYFIDAK